nr:hypothetical protein [Enterococcus faecalis]
MVVFIFPKTALAAPSKHVLLVYDSLNVAGEKENDVDALQRVLTSFGVEVQSVAVSDYIPGELLNADYDSLISMVNWPEQAGVIASDFLADRVHFKGKQLHIGRNIRDDEKQYFTGKWKELSHRQYHLEDEKGRFSQILPFQDQSVVLDGTDGETIGKLKTQELEPEVYPFGVIENGHGFIPMFERKGAIFLESVEVISKWLESEQFSRPFLTISGFNPLKEMSVATYLQEELVKTTYPYILSSTSVSVNNTILPYKLFTNALRSFAATGIIFLETPVVNNVDLNDQRALHQLLEQQISLLVDRHVYPVGISAPGYWNQDLQYQEDGLSISDTVILRENPPIDRVFYRNQTGESLTYKNALFDLPYDYLSGVEWSTKSKSVDYRFPMPTTVSFPFPNSKKEVDQLIQKIEKSPLIFSITEADQHFTLQTQTQKIEFRKNRFFLNNKIVNGMADTGASTVEKQKFTGVFAFFFNITNTILVVLVTLTLVILVVLFMIGRKNYRSKYINKEEDK